MHRNHRAKQVSEQLILYALGKSVGYLLNLLHKCKYPWTVLFLSRAYTYI